MNKKMDGYMRDSQGRLAPVEAAWEQERFERLAWDRVEKMKRDPSFQPSPKIAHLFSGGRGRSQDKRPQL
jgi:hypothetical protein